MKQVSPAEDSLPFPLPGRPTEETEPAWSEARREPCLKCFKYIKDVDRYKRFA